VARHSDNSTTTGSESAPPLPFDELHWRAIVEALELSPRQAAVLKLMLRGLPDKQIAAEIQISESTLRTYQSRIAARTRTRGRMELAMRVLEVSRQVDRHERCRQK